MTSTLLQNATPATNAMDEVKTGTVNTPENARSVGDEENPIHYIIANISYPTLEWLHDKHIVIHKACDPYVRAECKFFVQNKPAIVFLTWMPASQ